MLPYLKIDIFEKDFHPQICLSMYAIYCSFIASSLKLVSGQAYGDYIWTKHYVVRWKTDQPSNMCFETKQWLVGGHV